MLVKKLVQKIGCTYLLCMAQNKNIDGEKIFVKDTVLTWSNLISVSRILAAFAVIYIHYTNGNLFTTTITWLIVYGVISDYLDGFIARKTNSVSEFGKLLDPIADKLAVTALFVYTVYLGWIPLWFLIFSVVRDTLIMLGSRIIQRKYGKVAMSVMSGKISVNVQALYWISVFFLPGYQFADAHTFLMGAAVSAMLISFYDYISRFRQIMKGAEFN